MLSVRPEQPDDRAGVRQVHEAAFGQPGEADLVDRLRPTAAYVGLVAVEGGRVIGHIAFSAVTVDAAPPAFVGVGLAPMAVLPPHQRAGVGSALVRAGLAACERADAVVVLGHPTYYPRFGFEPAATLGLTCEYEVPSEAFMALALRPGALDGVRGTVRYHPAFSAL